MSARRALVIAVTTPVLLATIGMTGASAAPPKEPTAEGAIVQSKPHPGADRADGDSKHATEEEADEGLLTDFTSRLL